MLRNCTRNGDTRQCDQPSMVARIAKVDAADVMTDGRAFRDIDEFKQLLLADKDQLARGDDKIGNVRHRRVVHIP